MSDDTTAGPTNYELYLDAVREHAFTVFDSEDAEVIKGYIRNTLSYDPAEWLIEHIDMNLHELAYSAVFRVQYLADLAEAMHRDDDE